MEGSTYDRDDLLLDQRREGDELEEEGQVELRQLAIASMPGRCNRVVVVKRTEETRRASEIVCCARVIVAVAIGRIEAFDDGGMFNCKARCWRFQGL